jgi:hypothetical protein
MKENDKSDFFKSFDLLTNFRVERSFSDIWKSIFCELSRQTVDLFAPSHLTRGWFSKYEQIYKSYKTPVNKVCFFLSPRKIIFRVWEGISICYLQIILFFINDTFINFQKCRHWFIVY